MTERWLEDWIRPQLRGGEGDGRPQSIRPDTADRTGRDGATVLRMAREQEEVAAKLLGQSIMRKPRMPRKNPLRSR